MGSWGSRRPDSSGRVAPGLAALCANLPHGHVSAASSCSSRPPPQPLVPRRQTKSGTHLASTDIASLKWCKIEVSSFHAYAFRGVHYDTEFIWSAGDTDSTGCPLHWYDGSRPHRAAASQPAGTSQMQIGRRETVVRKRLPLQHRERSAGLDATPTREERAADARLRSIDMTFIDALPPR